VLLEGPTTIFAMDFSPADTNQLRKRKNESNY